MANFNTLALVLFISSIAKIASFDLGHINLGGQGQSPQNLANIQNELKYEDFMLFLNMDPASKHSKRLNRDTNIPDYYSGEDTYDNFYESSGEETDIDDLFRTPIFKLEDDDTQLGNTPPQVTSATGSTLSKTSTAESQPSQPTTAYITSTITSKSGSSSVAQPTGIEGLDQTTKRGAINQETRTDTTTDKATTPNDSLGQKSSADHVSHKDETDSTDITKSPSQPDTSAAGASWVIFVIVAVTVGVIACFIGFFIYRQCRKRFYGEYQEVSTKNGHLHTNGTELHRFDSVDNDANEMVSVPLYSDGDGVEKKVTSFKDSNLSPVNIETDDVAVDSTLLKCPLKIQYSDTPQEHAISNRGGRVKIVPGNGTSSISGGPLGDAVFHLDHCVVLWGGDTDQRGSAHTVNGRPFAAEIHFVHWDKSAHTSFQEASRTPGGLAIIAAFIMVDGDHGNQLTQICDNLRHISYKSQSWRISHFLTSTMLPEDTEHYWTYSGSLTSPPFTSDVTWIIFSQPISASKIQMQEFQSLKHHEKDEGHVTGKQRKSEDRFSLKVQPLGSRIIRVPIRES